MTSDTVPQTQLWELATYEFKPRLNRLNGVATVVFRAARSRNFTSCQIPLSCSLQVSPSPTCSTR